MVVGGLEPGRWDHATLAVEPAVVKPVDVGERGVLNIVKFTPGSLMADQLRLEESVERLREGIVTAVAA